MNNAQFVKTLGHTSQQPPIRKVEAKENLITLKQFSLRFGYNISTIKSRVYTLNIRPVGSIPVADMVKTPHSNQFGYDIEELKSSMVNWGLTPLDVYENDDSLITLGEFSDTYNTLSSTVRVSIARQGIQSIGFVKLSAKGSPRKVYKLSELLDLNCKRGGDHE
jgi:hypothetical protein